MRALIAGCRSFYLYLSALVSAAILAYPRLLDKFSLSLTWSLKACAFHQPNKRAEGPMQDSSATGGENPEILNRELLGSRLKHIENSVKPWMDKVFQWKGLDKFQYGELPEDAPQDMKEKYLLDLTTGVLDRALMGGRTRGPATGEAAGRPASTVALENSKKSIYSDPDLIIEPGSESIRLLELLQDGSGIVRASIVRFRSPRDHSYDALSYTWGSQKRDRKIIVNNREVYVSQNLHDALSSLRLPDRSRHLWIDALCVNQDDAVEIAAQIPMMGAIYSEAETVLVFLGMPSSQSYAFFDFLDRKLEHADVTEDSIDHIIDACEMDRLTLFSSLVEFCRRDWWTRVWVMQEHFLARSEPWWYIGSRYIHDSRLRRDFDPLALKVLYSFGNAIPTTTFIFRPTDHSTTEFSQILQRPRHTVYSRRQTKPYRTPRSLFATLDRKATYPQDYVYGLRELLEPHFRQVFIPELSVNVADLFTKLAAWLLILDGWGDMLWWYPYRLASSSVSWAPDFTRRLHPRDGDIDPPPRVMGETKMVQCAIVDRALYIDGCQLDVVTEVFEVPNVRDCFKVLQRVWQLEAAYCSSQCMGPSSVVSDWSSRSMLAWTSSLRPATIPLAPRWLVLSEVMGSESETYLRELESRFKTLPSGTKLDGSTSLEGAIREMRNLTAICEFLRESRDGDFISACVFDFENLTSQLQSLERAPTNANWVTDRLSPQVGHPAILYEDLIRKIRNMSGNQAEFRTLLSFVLRVARKVYSSRHRNTREFNFVAKRQRAKLVTQETIAKLNTELEEVRNRDNACGGAVRYRTRIDQLEVDIKHFEDMLRNMAELETQMDFTAEPDGEALDRLSENFAKLFRGREFFLTRTGLFGLGSPGVSGINAGDKVILLDGLSFPLVARRCGALHHAVVGCATVRGVQLHNKCEQAELPHGCTAGSKEMYAFV